MSRWIHCDVCKEEWTADSFTHAGSAYRYRMNVCNACFTERYPARYVDCTGCGKQMKTRGKSAPMCRPCRRAAKQSRPTTAPPPVPHCPECHVPVEGRTIVKGVCFNCYQRARRAVYRAPEQRRLAA